MAGPGDDGVLPILGPREVDGTVYTSRWVQALSPARSGPLPDTADRLVGREGAAPATLAAYEMDGISVAQGFWPGETTAERREAFLVRGRYGATWFRRHRIGPAGDSDALSPGTWFWISPTDSWLAIYRVPSNAEYGSDRTDYLVLHVTENGLFRYELEPQTSGC